MKSLDIVNRNIESVHDQLNDYDEDDEEYGFYPTYDILMYKLNELEIIKQDLEVLKTLKNDLEMMGFSVVDGEIVIDNADFKYFFEKEYYDVHPEVFKKLLEVEE